jgi:O-antigen ligase
MVMVNSQKTILPNNHGSNSQKYLKYFLIFTAWPVFSIGVSITLFLFLLLIQETKKKTKRTFLQLDKRSNRFYLFVLISFLSLLFSPWEKINISITSDIQIQIQYIYWILVAVFFMNTYKYMNKDELSKFIFIGLLLHTFHFFFLNFSSPIPFLRTYVSRNGFVFTILALWPLASRHIYSRLGKKKGNLTLVLMFLIMLLTDGRAGVVIIMIENTFIYFIYNKTNAKIIRAILVISIPLASILGPAIFNDENRATLGNAIEPISGRISSFIKGEGSSGDLTFDKSWLTRKLMIDKGYEIISDHPYFGVGIGHFSEYSAELKSLNSRGYQRLLGDKNYDEDYYNHKSAHNSYVHIASEMGLIGFIVLLFILLPPVLFALKKLYLLTVNQDDLILISLIGIAIHFYTITSLPGTVTWFVIGITYSQMYNSKYKRK